MVLSKNVNNKKCAPKLVIFNKKEIEKDSDDFWHKKLTLKAKFWPLLTAHQTSYNHNKFSVSFYVLQCSKVHLIRAYLDTI